MYTFTDKIALITGGSSGIGLATAELLDQSGAKVVIFGREDGSLKQSLTHLGASSTSVRGDVTSMNDLDHLYSTIGKIHGGIDILVINVGQGKLSSIVDTSEELFDSMIAVNFKGAFFTLQKAIPYLNKGASVIITTSYLNETGFKDASLLSASKAALRSLVRVAATELVCNQIRVNAVSPGAINTPFWGKIGLPQDILEGAAEQIRGTIPMQRFGEAHEVARVIGFLASDASSYITGTEIAVDGGINQV